MVLERVHPGLYNFLAGLAASAAVSLIVSVPLAPVALNDRLIIYSIPWFAISALLTWVAVLIDDARADADLAITATLTPEERGEIRAKGLAKIATKTRVILGLVGLLIAGFVVLNLYHAVP